MLFLLLSVSVSLRASWNIFGPDSITAHNVCFNVDNMNRCIICTDNGFWLGDGQFSNWEHFHLSHLPVWEACYQSGMNILLAMGNGSYSDGIYTFNPTTMEISLLEFIPMPHFICYQKNIQKYFVGYQGGMLSSECGINWVTESFFSGKNIVAMDFFNKNIVVSEMDNQLNIFYSPDGGNTWNTAPPGSPMISSMTFDFNGMLYGIFPDESWSSGFYSSENFGAAWANEFFSVNMSATGMDAMGNIFVGWGENPLGQEEGIACYDPFSGGLTFMNEGLSSLIVNKIRYNPAMSAMVLFCCTGNGVYFSNDYITALPKYKSEKQEDVKVFPNPSDGHFFIEAAPGMDIIGYTVYNPEGKIISKPEGNSAINKMPDSIIISGLPDGIYYLQIQSRNTHILKKIIILK